MMVPGQRAAGGAGQGIVATIPVIVTAIPTGPEVGDRLVMAGATDTLFNTRYME